ncbi:MAG: radical SAM protein [Gemmatimonadota bacterium]|nr:MAG: radical SAM protein [Gemmatimonadota bacterium]
MRITDDWILQHRGRRKIVDPAVPYAQTVEPERTQDGTIEDVATVFVTNKECPFRCLMCDLWQHTAPGRVPDGAVAHQIEWALERLPPAQHLKLYNAGSFFDRQAIPRADWPRIAQLLTPFHTVIVESHPRLIGQDCDVFAQMLNPRLQVAMGLETVDPTVLPRLNKRMTLDDFEQATRFLTDHAIDTRAFILLRTPFQSEQQGVEWAMRSIDYAFGVGVECCVVIPTRAGNGAMDQLQREGHFEPPSMESLEQVLDYGVSLGCGRVFADIWDLERFYTCEECGPGRKDRLNQVNLTQQVLPGVRCGCKSES